MNKKEIIIIIISTITSLFISLLLPERHDVSRIFIDAGNVFGKGYPFVFYVPGQFDYGLSFYLLPMIANAVIYAGVLFGLIFLGKKLKQNI